MTKTDYAKSTIKKWLKTNKNIQEGRLPSIIKMASLIGVSEITLRRAVKELTTEKLIKPVNGVGIMVCPKNAVKERLLILAPSTKYIQRKKSDYTYLIFDVYESIRQELEKQNMESELYVLDQENDCEKILDKYRTLSCSGIIILGHIDPLLVEEIINNIGSQKVVSANYSGVETLCNEIKIHPRPGIIEMLEKAYDFGHREFAMLYSPSIHSQRTQMERFSTFIEFIREKNLNLNTAALLPVEGTTIASYRASLKLLEECPKTTMIFAANDTRAIGALHALEEHNLVPGSDISVVGFDNMPGSEEENLATVSTPREKIGQAAVKLFLELNEKNIKSIRRIWLDTEPLLRSSLGPLKVK
jgi:DNA-binding LacI/PurR family transcriptional regulator